MRSSVLLLTSLFVLVFSTSADAGLKIYYIRHGESGANVLNQWKDKPKSEWPPYVGNADTFTPLGETQVTAAIDKLKKYHFDFIAVSPLWRTKHTILPYLNATGQKGEIWPELVEIKGAEKTPEASELIPPTPNLFTGGTPIVLSEEESACLALRPDGKVNLSYGWNTPQADSDRLASAEKVIHLIESRFGQSDKSVLLVGHGNAGRYLLNVLAGYKDQRIKNSPNTAIWMAEQQPDGTFRVELLNDKPFDAAKLKP